MSREWVNNEAHQWAMFCDRCRHQDPEVTSRQQPLEIYSDRGWWVARHYGDLCPTCRTQVPINERAEPFPPRRVTA